ncbi:MAG: DUF3105 domain-containing protein [Gaiellaceae bacterium]
MAKKKKSRVPAPPKRTVQAPRPYHAPRDPRRTRLLFLGLGAAILVAAAVVGVTMVAAGGDGGGVEASEVCDVEDLAPMGRAHVQELEEGFEYNSIPATSGPHYAQPRGPAIWNVYTDPVRQESLVHNLEHGGVVIQYGSEVPQATVAQIVDWYQDDPRGLLVAPLLPELAEQEPALDGRIAVTAWTHLMTCDTFDEDAFDDFVDEFRGPQGDAPEKFPLDALQPGSQ